MKKVVSVILLLSVLAVTSCTDIQADNDVSGSSAENNSVSSYTSDSYDFFDESSNISSDIQSSVDQTETSEESVNSVESSDPFQNASVEISDEASLSSTDNSSSVSDSSSDVDLPVQTPDDSVFVSNGILIAGTRGMEQFYGSEDSAKRYSGYVSAFKKDLGDDVRVYSVVAPHASCFYAPESYKNLLSRGQIIFDCLASNASDFSHIDTLGILRRHVDEEIYPRTEHHWNSLAAYYVAEEFAKVAGVSFDTLENFEKIEKDGFVGTLYSFSGYCSVLKNNPENFVIYKPTSAYTAYFCNSGNYDFDKFDYTRDSVVFDVKSYPGAFLGGDSVSVKIVTGNSSGRKLVIFKDSYGNAFVPFTVGSFDEIYVLDIRYYNNNGVDFCKSVGATDVAFVVSAFTAAGTVYKSIEKIRTA